MSPIKVTACCALLFCVAAPMQQVVAAAPGTVPAELQSFTPEFTAYAQVQPRTVVTVRTAVTGVVAAFRVLPGERVRPGQELAKLEGPDYDSAVAAARSRRDAARSNLDTARRNYPQFSSAQDVANDRAALEEAQSTLDALQAGGRVLAPAQGIVLTLDAAPGERVASGEPLLTLQPDNQLWLRAVYYGADAAAIHVGMSGEFRAADGGQPIPIQVASVFGALAPDGGESVSLRATTTAPGWVNGRFGSVTLDGTARQCVTVPTRALVLDRGRWWVLVRTPRGFQPREVMPGPARGWQTFIVSGLTPGAQVLAENAYLEYYRSISKNYQPPD